MLLYELGDPRRIGVEIGVKIKLINTHYECVIMVSLLGHLQSYCVGLYLFFGPLTKGPFSFTDIMYISIFTLYSFIYSHYMQS